MYTKESFQEKIDVLYPNEELQVIEFNGSTKPCSIQCLKCQSIYTNKKGTYFVHSGRKSICKKCQGYKEITKEIKNKILYITQKTNIEIIKDFTLISEDMIFKCPKCQEIFQRKPRIFLETQKCPYCESRSKTKPLSVFQEDLKKRYGEEYKIIGEYINAQTPILFEHIPCGFKWKVRPNDILQKAPCPRCKKYSRGEKEIEYFLNIHKIDFIAQKRFKELDMLSYDFYVPQFNLLIEFQGEQHYKPIKHFGGEEKFKYQQEHDKLKRDFAKKEGYTLLEIKYTDIKNIQNILLNFIAQRLNAQAS